MENFVKNTSIHSDQSIIDGILEGDVSLFKVLVRRYNPVLYRIARSYGFNHQNAEDLMQDTYIAAYMDLAHFEGRASFKTWMSRIMVNRCLYKLKYGYFKHEGPGLPILNPNAQPMHLKPKDMQTEGQVANHELAVVLEKSLQHLPVIYRTVFVLREVEGFSVVETAELLQITPLNVKVRLSRAKALLQKEVEQFYSRADIYSFCLIYCDGMVQRVLAKIQALKGQS
jgi:RNA polymerase sigma-70 factor (ECF subfamily)